MKILGVIIAVAGLGFVAFLIYKAMQSAQSNANKVNNSLGAQIGAGLSGAGDFLSNI